MQLYIHLRSIFPPCTWVYDSSFWPEIQRGVMETLPFYLSGQFILPLHASTVLDTCFCVRSAPIVNFWGELVLVSFFFFYIFLLLFKYSFLPFPPALPTTSALPISLPCFHPMPLVIFHMSFIIVPAKPSTLSPVIPSPLLSGHCQPVLNFSVSGYILLACSFC